MNDTRTMFNIASKHAIEFLEESELILLDCCVIGLNPVNYNDTIVKS